MLRSTCASSRRVDILFAIKARQVAALALVVAIMLLLIPPAAARSSVSAITSRTSALGDFLPQIWGTSNRIFGTSPQVSLPQENQPRPQTIPPRNPRTRTEREARVGQLDLNVPRQLTLQRGQRMTFSATPLDADRTAVHGLHVKWESSDRRIIFVKRDGRALAGNPGTANVRARAGNSEKIVQVTVVASTSASRDIENPLNDELSNSTSTRETRRADKRRSASPDKAIVQRSHVAGNPRTSPQDPPALPAEDVPTLFEKRNAVGSPPNRYFPTAPTPPAANRRGREMPGSDNYSFSVPVIDLPGRGLDVSLDAAYNGSLWHKMGTNGNRLQFDVNKSWPAPGFRLGYGYLESQNNGKYLLVDADGTRHEMLNDAPYPYPPSYITTDGTFIRLNGQSLTHTDGTQVYYGAAKYVSGITTYWPTKITDRHGNYLVINYPTDSYGNQFGPRITSIIDTLGRYIRFYYDSNNNLVTITAPGYADGPDRQEVRFYYETITDFTNTAKFASNITVTNRPTSIQVIKYIYFPGTQGGYRYDYSPYGMIRKIVQLRGMTVSTTALDQIGSVNPGAQEAATTTYDYPDTTPPAGLTAAPTYSHRVDDWSGRTSVIPVTTFEVGSTVKVTAPDGTISETASDEDGDTSEIKRTTQFGTYVYARTRLGWETDVYGRNRRIKRVQTTTDAYLTAAKTKTVDFTYTDFNNVDEVIEYDFNTAPDTPGPILRRTKATYVTDASFADRQAYINRGLLRLPTSVKVFAGTSSTPVSRVDYVYDSASLEGYLGSDPEPIQNYDQSKNPYAPAETVWDWLLNDPNCTIGPPNPPSNNCPCCPAHWGSYTVPVYDPATAKRGNLTSMTAYADAAGATGASTDTMTYDIVGNLITETADCCQQRSYNYTAAYQFAYPESETRGTGSLQMTTSAVYDFDTGALRTSTDENNQTTTLHYYPESLRLYETVRPDGGITDLIYFGDQLFADPDAAHMHSAVMSITSLDTQRTVRSWQFADGRGQVARTFGENAGQGHVGASYVEYDVMGRLYRASNPYYAVYGGATEINPTGLWTTYAYDPLGRPTTVTLQDLDLNTVRYDYAGEMSTFTDQAGKQRRQTVDALGRVIQLDEPDSAGVLNQATTYLYNSLNNLVKITQGTEQQRYFKYDSLSRLTHERQVEQDAPHVQTDPLTGNSNWSRKIVYNSDNLVTDSWDARGIQTHVTYDGLNRISQITYTGEAATTTTPTVTYSYDELRAGYFNRGRLTTVTTAAGGGTLTPVPQTAQALDYDRMGRVQSQRQTIGTTTYNLGYGFNLLGQLTSQTYPSGRVIDTGYDAAARLNSLGQTGQTYANSFAYAGHGGLTSETWGNGAVHTMTYNERLQVKQIKLAVGGAEKQRFDYQYGEVNVDTAALDKTKNTGQVAVVDGWIDGVKQWQQRYAYDKLGRLSTAKELNNDQTGSQAWRVDYTYDRWGNRYQAAGQGGVPVIDSDIDKSRNRFVTVGSTLMIYDAAGNLTIDQKFRGMQFTYDANGRMRRSDATTRYGTSVYDAFGLRVQSFDSLTNLTRNSVIDAFGRVVADYENGVWKRDYLYRSTSWVLLSTVEASSTRYVLPDHQGSTRVVTNQTGQVTSRHDYRPFGEEIPAGTGMRTTGQGYTSSSPLRHQYALTERDSANGLDHTWFRKLDSLSGRWTSPDPYLGGMSLSDPQSLNRIAYVENDPINFIDPTGLFWAIDLMSCRMEVRCENGECWFTGREICSLSWEEPKDCYAFADEVERIANEILINNLNPATNSYPHNVSAFMDALAARFSELGSATDAALARVSETGTQLNSEFGSSGFASQFVDPDPGSANQARHSVFGLVMGFTGAGTLLRNVRDGDTRSALQVANGREDNTTASGRADIAVNNLTVPMGEQITGSGGQLHARGLANWIRNNLCARR